MRVDPGCGTVTGEFAGVATACIRRRGRVAGDFALLPSGNTTNSPSKTPGGCSVGLALIWLLASDLRPTPRVARPLVLQAKLADGEQNQRPPGGLLSPRWSPDAAFPFLLHDRAAQFPPQSGGNTCETPRHFFEVSGLPPLSDRRGLSHVAIGHDFRTAASSSAESIVVRTPHGCVASLGLLSGP